MRSRSTRKAKATQQIMESIRNHTDNGHVCWRKRQAGNRHLTYTRRGRR